MTKPVKQCLEKDYQRAVQLRYQVDIVLEDWVGRCTWDEVALDVFDYIEEQLKEQLA